MNIRPIGGIFWRLDANGNLTAYDTSGAILARFIGGVFSAQLNKGAIITNAPIISTTSIAEVHKGNGRLLTPRTSGNVLLVCTLRASNSIAADGCDARLFFKVTAAIPAGGTLVDGTWSGLGPGVNRFFSSAANVEGQIVLTTLATGLVIDTTYVFAVAIAAITGGTATFNELDYQSVEL